MLLTYHSIFYAQGMLTSLWFKILEEYIQKFINHKFFPFFLIFFYLSFGFMQPANYSEVGFRYFYPLYDNTYIQSFHTTGSWLYCYLIIIFNLNVCNQPFDKTLFGIFINSSMFVYLSHDLWLQVVIHYMINPLVKHSHDN